MEENDLDGVFLQHLVTDLGIGSVNRSFRNQVQLNVQQAAEESERVFAIMYDISGVQSPSDIEVLKAHWKKTVDDKVTGSSAYLNDLGRPLLGIWESYKSL